jgi:hypothetical protein
MQTPRIVFGLRGIAHARGRQGAAGFARRNAESLTKDPAEMRLAAEAIGKGDLTDPDDPAAMAAPRQFLKAAIQAPGPDRMAGLPRGDRIEQN